MFGYYLTSQKMGLNHLYLQRVGVRGLVLWWHSLTMKYIKKGKTATKICNRSLTCKFHTTIFLGILGMSLCGDTLRVVRRLSAFSKWLDIYGCVLRTRLLVFIVFYFLMSQKLMIALLVSSPQTNFCDLPNIKSQLLHKLLSASVPLPKYGIQMWSC